MFNKVYAEYYANEAGNTIFSGANGVQTIGFGEFLLLAISVIIFVGFILSIVFILWGGLLLILSGGKEEKTKPAINTIRYAILGIFITVGAVFLAPILGNLLGMQQISDYFKPQAIYERITELGNKMLGQSGGSTMGSSDVYNGSKTNLDDLDF